jgi:NAD dependent epimerase/dehydratase family
MPVINARCLTVSLTGIANFRWGPLIVGDIRDQTTLTAYTFDTVLHCAALAYVGESMTSPGQYYDVNVGGTRALVEAMTRAGVTSIVFSSSCAVYGEPIPPRPPTISAIPCRPPRRACTAQSICSASPSAPRRASSGPRPASSTAIPRFIRNRRPAGGGSIRSECAPATTKASAAARRCSSTITARTFSTFASPASSTPTVRACTPTTAGGRIQLHRPGFEGPADHDPRRRQPDAELLLHRSAQPRQSGRNHRARPGQFELEITGSKSEIVFRPLPEDDPRQRQPDIGLARDRFVGPEGRPADWPEHDGCLLSELGSERRNQLARPKTNCVTAVRIKPSRRLLLLLQQPG